MEDNDKKAMMSVTKINAWLLGICFFVPMFYTGYIGAAWALYKGWPPPDIVSLFGAVGCLIVIILSIGSAIYDVIKRKNAKTQLNHIMFIVTAIFVFGMIIPPLGSSRERMRQTSCASNLKVISHGLKEYADDHHGWYPDKNGAEGLEMLRKDEYLSDYKVYICPSTITPAATGADPLTEATVSYEYYGGYRSDSPKGTVIMRDKDKNHLYYGSVLYADGFIAAVKGKDWTKAIPVR